MEKKRIKTGGRRLNSLNKTTAEIRNLFSNLLSANIELIQKDLDQMTPKERVYILLKLSEFVIPKAKELEVLENTDSFSDRFIEALQLKK